MDWLTPSSRKQLQQFLGFANFYRRFIRDYSKVAAPLTRLTSTLQSFQWSPEAKAAFNKLKGLFSSSPVLAHPDPSWQFVGEVDASDVGFGAVLSQRNGEDQKLYPCAFFIHRLSPAERNYDMGNVELLAVVLALQEWRHWLDGAALPFVVWTDHKNLTYLQNAKRLHSPQTRWALFLGRFQFTLTYRPGSRNQKLDALSRQFSSDPVRTDPDPIFPPSCILGAASWRGSARPCNLLRIQVEAHQTVSTFGGPALGPRLETDLPPGSTPFVTVPSAAFLEALHDLGHQGIYCGLPFVSHQPPAGLLQPLGIPRWPWSHIAMDFVIGLPPSDGHQVILTVVDHFSKAAHFVPLNELPSAVETGELLVQHVFLET